MKRAFAAAAALLLWIAAASSHAAFHMWIINQIYSNADGSIQFIVLTTSQSGEDQLGGRILASTPTGGMTRQFPFPSNLPSSVTANKHVLIGTSGFAALGIVTPDYTIPNGFLATDGGTLNYAGADQLSWLALPTDGANAIDRGGYPIPNVATNFAGASGSVTGESPPAMYSLSLTKTGSGAVTSQPAGIDCGTECAYSYTAGTNILLVPTPDAGWIFSQWTGSCAGTLSCMLAMTADWNAGATFNFSGAGSANSNLWVQKAYVGYYGRPADPPGLAYWAARMDAEGGSLASIIAAFGTSDEFTRRYGGLGDSVLVDTLYQQTLGRLPDPVGKQFYLDQLAAGRTTLQVIALDLLGGVTGDDVFTVDNRLDVANHYTGKVAGGCAYGGELTGVQALASVASAIGTDFAAKAAIETRCGF